MKFYQYYKKPWHAHWWARVLIVFFFLAVIVGVVLALAVYGEVRFLIQNPDQLSVFTEANKNTQLGVLEVRSLVESYDDPYFGPVDSDIVIVEFGDFECPFCARSFPAVRAMMNKYADRIKWIYRDFPIFTHPYAMKAAQAAECAYDQGKFWEMHDKIFLNQDRMSVDFLKRYATEIGLDVSKFNSCLDSGTKRKEVEEDMAAGIKAGVQGTPTFYFNGFPWFGAIDEETLEAIIGKLIEKTKDQK